MPQISRQLDARLDLVPQSPGVYLMKDTAGSVIYVGKAVNLRNRLRSYFTARPQGTPKVLAMIARIADFTTILCANELEALVLESTLIKKHLPQYNILLRDDRDYPYIRVTLNETYPRILKAFRIGDDRREGAHYYGPYLAGDVFRALEALRSIFPLKTCRRLLPRDIGKERPCLNYHIGRCIGPCKGDVPTSAYRDVMDHICLFLEGRYDGLLDNLRRDMEEASAELHFEEAALLRDRIRALEKLMNRQKVVSNRPEDRDVLGLANNGNEICLQKLEIRHGRLVAAAAFFWPENGLDVSELISSFITQHYPDAALIPPEILVPVQLADEKPLMDFLRGLRSGRCLLHWPQRGAGRELLQMAQTNAEEALRRHTLLGGSGETALQEALRLLAELTGMDQPPHRIEALDISNTGQQDQASSLVVFQDGRPARQQYRQFKLEQNEGTDDYEAMRETLRRRLRHIDEQAFGSRPDLILADGGRGHVAALQQVMREMNLTIPVAGMVKDERHRTRGLVTADGRVVNLRPEQSAGRQNQTAAEPGILDDDPELRISESSEDSLLPVRRMMLLRLLTAIQDEAHRFANRYRGKLQKKRQTRFTLEGIPGIGPAKRRVLLQQFQTIKKVSEAGLDDLLNLHGLGEPAARAVYQHFHQEE
ncbi:MAG: excinuclease ABC subunit UvrC [Clostridiaceae bacterium]|nr:excinuclease ABC subunit UvrC [Clostridiaceae bacterium]